jgi:hypothetical protein
MSLQCRTFNAREVQQRTAAAYGKKPSVSRLRGLSPEEIDDLHPLGIDYLRHGERG